MEFRKYKDLTIEEIQELASESKEGSVQRVLLEEILAERLKERTWSGFHRKVKVLGSNSIDSYHEKKMFEHRGEIEEFYKKNPGLGRAKKYDK